MASVRAWVACSSEDWQVAEKHRGFQLAICKDFGKSLSKGGL